MWSKIRRGFVCPANGGIIPTGFAGFRRIAMAAMAVGG